MLSCRTLLIYMLNGVSFFFCLYSVSNHPYRVRSGDIALGFTWGGVIKPKTMASVEKFITSLIAHFDFLGIKETIHHPANFKYAE